MCNNSQLMDAAIGEATGTFRVIRKLSADKRCVMKRQLVFSPLPFTLSPFLHYNLFVLTKPPLHLDRKTELQITLDLDREERRGLDDRWYRLAPVTWLN